jgi:hypothetical protein
MLGLPCSVPICQLVPTDARAITFEVGKSPLMPLDFLFMDADGFSVTFQGSILFQQRCLPLRQNRGRPAMLSAPASDVLKPRYVVTF